MMVAVLMTNHSSAGANRLVFDDACLLLLLSRPGQRLHTVRAAVSTNILCTQPPRRVKAAVRSGWRQQLAVAVTVFVLAYTTALMETVTIAHFPYYTHKV